MRHLQPYTSQNDVPLTFNQEAKGDVEVLKRVGPTQVRHEKNFQNEGRSPRMTTACRPREQHFQTRR